MSLDLPTSSTRLIGGTLLPAKLKVYVYNTHSLEKTSFVFPMLGLQIVDRIAGAKQKGMSRRGYVLGRNDVASLTICMCDILLY